MDVGCRPIVDDLIQAGADVNGRDGDEATPLHWAARCKSEGASLDMAGEKVPVRGVRLGPPEQAHANSANVELICTHTNLFMLGARYFFHSCMDNKPNLCATFNQRFDSPACTTLLQLC